MSDPFKGLGGKSISVTEQIYTIIREGVTKGKLKPGDKLPSEEQMAARFDVSKSVVREALGKLVGEGLIIKRRGALGGSYVAEFSPNRVTDVVNDLYHLGGLTLDEVVEFRRLIEPIVLELAAARRTEEDIEAMRLNLEDCGKNLNEGRINRKKQVEFHSIAAAACHNRLISTVMNAALNISYEMTSKVELTFKEGNNDYQVNQKYFEYVLHRKPERGRELLKKHFDGLEKIQRRLK